MEVMSDCFPYVFPCVFSGENDKAPVEQNKLVEPGDVDQDTQKIKEDFEVATADS